MQEQRESKEIVILNSSHREYLVDEIFKKMDETTKHVHLSIRPTIGILVMILTAAPNLELITCPPSLYERTPEKIKKALEKVGVKFQPLLLSPGRPRSHPEWKIEKISELENKGLSLKDISSELNLPEATVHYYIRKRGRKRKKEE